MIRHLLCWLGFHEWGCPCGNPKCRAKTTGYILVKKINFTQLSRAVKPYLMSIPDFEINQDKTKGKVYAGWHSWDFTIEVVK